MQFSVNPHEFGCDTPAPALLPMERLNKASFWRFSRACLRLARTPVPVQHASQFSHENANGTLGRALMLPAQGPTLGTTSYHANDIMGEYGLPVIAGTYMLSSNEDNLYITLASQVYSNYTSGIA